jgi:hypothetical protein
LQRISRRNAWFFFAAVVFSDGTFEGELDSVARLLGMEWGRTVIYERALPLWKDSTDRTSADHREVLAETRSRLWGLATDPDPRILALFLSRYPDFDPHESAGSETRRTVRALRTFQESLTGQLRATRDRLVQTVDDYARHPEVELSEWLSGQYEEYVQFLRNVDPALSSSLTRP